MRAISLQAYRCPVSGAALTHSPAASGRETEQLVSSSGHVYPIRSGIVDFTHQMELECADANARQQYDAQAGEAYDNAMQWLWTAFQQDEQAVRSGLIDQLDVRPGQKVLEIGCGGGSDSRLIAERLQEGALFLQDLSYEMLRLCKGRLQEWDSPKLDLEFSVSPAVPLPFADGYFDRVFHFGGLNMFSDIAAAMKEMARVTRVGGKIVVGDESVAPWLRQSEFGRVVINNNKLYEAPVPLDNLPECARDVALQFIVANTFYVISFTVGEGPPTANFDLPHKGRRGGTMRTRYYGQLEGVSLDAKKQAIAAAAAAGKSLHEWLDDAVRAKAARDLGQKD